MEQRQSKFLRDTHLDEVRVRTKLVNNFSSTMFIENSHVLPQNGSQVLLLNIPRDSFTCVDKTNRRNVLGGKGFNGYVGKIKCVLMENRGFVFMGPSAIFDISQDSCYFSEDNLQSLVNRMGHFKSTAIRQEGKKAILLVVVVSHSQLQRILH